MTATRKCPLEKLSKQPLALVLIQIRFSPVTNMEKFIPQIQNGLRTMGYPLVEENGSISITVTPDGVKQIPSKQWVFKTGDECSNIILDGGQLTFQTSDYDAFELFYSRFLSVCTVVFENIESFIKVNLIQRLGLRYVNRIIPENRTDTVDSYIADGFKVSQASLFERQQKVCTISQAGEVAVADDKKGVLVFRITQGEKGLILPPDLMAKPPRMRRELNPDMIIGMIDTDHSYMPLLLLKYDKNELERLFFSMHDNVINLFRSIVSAEGKRKWH
jgi:uncharacterized protein (TIGR04255 family)